MTDQTVLLRAPEPTDIDLLYQWENDPSLWQAGNTLAPFSRHEIEQFVLNSQSDIYQNRQLRLMIELPDTKKTVGTLDFFEFDPIHRRAGIGIFISAENRARGWAGKAILQGKSFAFQQLQLNQLYCHIQKDNIPSLRLFKRNGFVEVGNLRKWLCINQQWQDVLLFQCLNE